AGGDDREGFEHGTRVAGRFVRMNALEEFLVRGARLEAPAARGRHELDTAVLPRLAQLFEQPADRVCADIFVEYLAQLRDRKGLLCGEQSRLKHDLHFTRIEHEPASRRWARKIRTARPRSDFPSRARAPRGN